MRKSLFTPLFLVALLLLAFNSCHQENEHASKGHDNDSLLTQQAIDTLRAVASTGDLERTKQLADSFLDLGRITVARGEHMLGVAHFYRGEGNEAVEYWKKVIDICSKGGEDPTLYTSAVLNVASFMASYSQYEEALHVLMPAVNEFMNNPAIGLNLKGQLHENIGACQFGLDRYDESEKSYEEAYRCFQEYIKGDFQLDPLWQCVIGTSNMFIHYDPEMTEKKMKWTDRCESMLNFYKQQPGANADNIDWMFGQICLSRAMVLTVQKKPAEAEKAYQQFLGTAYSKTDSGKYNSMNYLVRNERFAEAADIYQDFDRTAAEWGIEMNLDVIVGDLFPKFRYNYHAGRKDSAMAVILRIDTLIGPAYEQQQKSDAAKLATIYETQKKEAQIARQQAQLSEQRMWAAAIVFTLITLFFIIYTIHRRRAAKRLAEMKAAQERIESELRIARNIQMSMVPSMFPDYEGLDMFASMTPAKEVGGDLYGYVLLGDKLYFAVGDVSGKGVPASLFMAQATRLFRTLAAQQMMPSEICCRMNDALSGEDNESSMFVTFFLGLVDLKTGHLDFCNAGHNPPIIDGGDQNGDFIDMIPNAPIGLFPGLDYEGEEIESIMGRTLFIYTDGLNEAENRQQQQFGDDRLLDILRVSHFDSAQQVVETLKAEVEAHRDGAEPNDDLTMMCIHIS